MRVWGNLRGSLGEGGVTLDIYDDSSCMLPWNGERKSHREDKTLTPPADLHILSISAFPPFRACSQFAVLHSRGWFFV